MEQPEPTSSDTEDPSELVGQVVAGYRVRRRVGEGGMGAVYLADDLQHDRPVVLKVLHPEMAAEPEFVARLHREARAATSIGHPHIVEVFEVGSLPSGEPFLAMEYLDGRSLDDLLEEEGPLSIGRAARLAYQVCTALGAAHDRGIVHRDVKLDNVFVVEREGDEFVKVLDFGISKFLDPEADEAKLTRTGTAIGTPSYMAPEQIQGLPSVDHRADLYALGVILFELVTGDLPFSASTYAALLLKAVTEEPPSLRERRPEAPVELESLVASALAKDPDERPPDARVFADGLLPFLNEEPARDDLGWTRELTWSFNTASAPDDSSATRDRAGAPGRDMPVAIGTERSSGATPERESLPASAAPADASRSRRMGLALAAVVLFLLAVAAGGWIRGRWDMASAAEPERGGESEGGRPTSDSSPEGRVGEGAASVGTPDAGSPGAPPRVNSDPPSAIAPPSPGPRSPPRRSREAGRASETNAHPTRPGPAPAGGTPASVASPPGEPTSSGDTPSSTLSADQF